MTELEIMKQRIYYLEKLIFKLHLIMKEIKICLK
jgi:hypothetical protein